MRLIFAASMRATFSGTFRNLTPDPGIAFACRGHNAKSNTCAALRISTTSPAPPLRAERAAPVPLQLALCACGFGLTRAGCARYARWCKGE